MKKIYWPILAFIGLLSSCDFLDVVPEKLGTMEYVFRDKRNAETFLATCYSYLPSHEHHTSSVGRTMGNEVTTYFRNREKGVVITTEGNRVTDPYLNYWDGSQEGKNLYRALRDCNDFLDNIHLTRDMDSGERGRWIAEVRFLKAYYHWVLIQHYGPIVLVKKNIPIGASPEEVKEYRSPMNECIDYVVQLLNECIDANEEGESPLPLKVDDELNEYGRITRPIAAAIRAKILVHAASPFYNGNSMYSNFVDKRGIQLISPTYDAAKWKAAADACKAAIDICHDAGMGLFEYEPDFSPKISETTRLILFPSQLITTRQNKEAIWEQVKVDSRNVQFYCMPALDSEYRRVMVRSQLSPTLATAENFYSANGVPIEEDKEWLDKGWYSNRYTTTTSDSEHALMIEKGMTVPYLNLHREPRFYGSMAFNGSRWFGGGYKVPEKANAEEYQYTVKSLAGNTSTNPAGRVGQQYYSATGYFIRKLASYKTNVPTNNGGFTEEKYFWPIMRMADLYLLYAEALNESQEAPTPDIWENWIDPIRKRSGLKGVADSWSKHSIYSEKCREKNGLRNIIHQERIIELAFEGHNYYDIRRWSGGTNKDRYDIMDQMNQPIKGWNCDGMDDESYNQVRVIYSISYSLRDYLWPIKESNIDVNPNLVQNPGW